VLNVLDNKLDIIVNPYKLKSVLNLTEKITNVVPMEMVTERMSHTKKMVQLYLKKRLKIELEIGLGNDSVAANP